MGKEIPWVALVISIAIIFLMPSVASGAIVNMTGENNGVIVNMTGEGAGVIVGEGPLDNYTLTMAVTGNGTTVPAVGNHSYSNGSIVNVTAVPAAYWYFINWTGNVSDPNSTSTNVTMDANKTVTANFDQVNHTLTMAVVGNGTTTPNVGNHSYANGTVVNITAVPDAHWAFVNWTTDGNISEIDNPGIASTTVLVDANKTVTATFSEVNYTATTPAYLNFTKTMLPLAIGIFVVVCIFLLFGVSRLSLQEKAIISVIIGMIGVAIFIAVKAILGS